MRASCGRVVRQDARAAPRRARAPRAARSVPNAEGPAQPDLALTHPPEPAGAIDGFGVRVQRARGSSAAAKVGVVASSTERSAPGADSSSWRCRRAAPRAVPASRAPTSRTASARARLCAIQRRTASGGVGQQLDVTGRRPRLGAEHRGDRRRIAGVEFALAARRFDDRRSGKTEPHAGQQCRSLRGAGQHRRAAEDVGDADDEHRNAGRAQRRAARRARGRGPIRPHWLRAGARPRMPRERRRPPDVRPARARTGGAACRRGSRPRCRRGTARPARRAGSSPRRASRARRRRRHRPGRRCPSARDAATAAAPRTRHRPDCTLPGSATAAMRSLGASGRSAMAPAEPGAWAHMAILASS